MTNNTVARSLDEVGLAAWFGGSLANAVSLNAAAGAVDDPAQRGRVANVGWDRWTPVNAAAIGAHVAGSVGELASNRQRLFAQRGVATMSALKTGLMGTALGLTAYSRVLGRKVSDHRDVPVEAGTAPAAETPDDVAKAQKQLRLLQWAVPALTGVLLVVNAYAGEQQRPSETRRGVLDRLLPTR
ncbi:MAG: hypothetical protein ACXV3F_15165 [Frankiaceae bacterium]